MSDVAVVTGASRGIGAATARRLAADGYRVLAAARTVDALARVAASHENIRAAVTDLNREEDIERLADAASAEGNLAVWVNNAATLQNVAFAELDYVRWQETLRVDLDAVFLGAHLAFRRMAHGSGGVIVNVASLGGMQNVEKFPGLTAYNVAKSGVIALTESVALEGRAHGVRCVCLSPGAVDTPMLAQANPALRPGVTADDVAAIIAWLVTPAAAPLSGSNIPIFSNV